MRQSRPNRQADLIEKFLLEGGPERPEARATKEDLIWHVRKRDELLIAIRAIFLKTIAQEFVGNLEESP